MTDRVFARRKQEPDNDIVDQAYKVARSWVSRKNQQSKREHHEEYFTEHESNIKKTWEGLRNLVHVKIGFPFLSLKRQCHVFI